MQTAKQPKRLVKNEQIHPSAAEYFPEISQCSLYFAPKNKVKKKNTVSF